MTVSRNRATRSQPMSRIPPDTSTHDSSYGGIGGSNQDAAHTGSRYPVNLPGGAGGTQLNPAANIADLYPGSASRHDDLYAGLSRGLSDSQVPVLPDYNKKTPTAQQFFPGGTGLSIGQLHKDRFSDLIVEDKSWKPEPARDAGHVGLHEAENVPQDRVPYGMRGLGQDASIFNPDVMAARASPYQSRIEPNLSRAFSGSGHESAAKIQTLLTQNSQLQSEIEQVKFMNAELTRSKMLLAAEVELLREDQRSLRNQTASRAEETEAELGRVTVERQSMIRQVSTLQTELRQREAVLDALSSQNKSQADAIHNAELANVRLREEVSYLQEQLQLRTEESRKLREQVNLFFALVIERRLLTHRKLA
jgi:hypothetical protein